MKVMGKARVAGMLRPSVALPLRLAAPGLAFVASRKTMFINEHSFRTGRLFVRTPASGKVASCDFTRTCVKVSGANRERRSLVPCLQNWAKIKTATPGGIAVFKILAQVAGIEPATR
jgi:hypothetical protein